MPKRPKKKKVVESEDYLFEILDWEFDYMFSSAKGMRTNKSFWEHAGIRFSTKMLAPDKYRDEALEVEFAGSRIEEKSLICEEDNETPSLSVGHLIVRKNERRYYGSIPMSVLLSLPPSLESKRTKYITLHGEKLFRGSARITSIGIKQSFDPDDYY